MSSYTISKQTANIFKINLISLGSIPDIFTLEYVEKLSTLNSIQQNILLSCFPHCKPIMQSFFASYTPPLEHIFIQTSPQIFSFVSLCKMNHSIMYLVILAAMVPKATYSQLTINSDQFHNSYSVQTPHMQQTFTRYYGNQPGGLQAARQTVQQTQYVSSFIIS